MFRKAAKIVRTNMELFTLVWNIAPNYVICMVFLDIIYLIVSLCNLYILKEITNYLSINEHGAVFIIIIYSIFVGFICATSTLTIILNQKIHSYEGNRLDYLLSVMIFNKLQNVDASNYENTEFYNNLMRSIGQFHMISSNVIKVVSSFLCSIIMIFFINFLLFDLLFLIGILLRTLNTIMLNKNLNKYNFEISQQTSGIERKVEYIAEVYASRKNAKELRLYSSLSNFFIIHNSFLLESKKHIVNSVNKKKILVTILSNLVNCSLDLFIIGYVGYLFIMKSADIGVVVLAISTFSLMFTKLNDVFNIFPDLYNNSLYSENVQWILNLESKISKNPNGLNALCCHVFDIEFKNVFFAYPNSPDKIVLKDISIKIENKKSVAIVGENGSGKSTFVKLLLYLYSQDSGDIFFSSKNYNEYELNSLQSCFGTVFQDFQVYSFTIAENVLMRNVESDLDEKLVLEALEFVGLSEKILKSDLGIFTKLTMDFSEDGIFLSGGELQKLAIARAYARKCKILVFDEPSSELDPFSEQEIFNQIMRLRNEKTIIYITHRLSTVVDADMIILFNDGGIKESGNHKELIKLKGKYYDMFITQAEKYKTI